MPDLLESLWVDVINLDFEPGWKGRLERARTKQSPLAKQAVSALKTLALKKADVPKLVQLCRSVRYEATFGTLFALSDPGIDKGKVKDLATKFDAQETGGKPVGKGSLFFKSLWDLVSPDDNGKWLLDLAAKKAGTEPFDDAGPAVAALIKSGASPADLGSLCSWHRYDACLETLRMLEKSGVNDAEEVYALYESLLGADPSGMEGRPGSWPLKHETPGH